jgi:hypothetical protein
MLPVQMAVLVAAVEILQLARVALETHQAHLHHKVTTVVVWVVPVVLLEQVAVAVVQALLEVLEK